MGNPLSTWNELCTSAVLGTDRTGASLSRTDGKLGSVLERLNPENGTARFMQAAAAVSVYCRAGSGWPAARSETVDAAPADPDTVSAPAGRLLSRILEEGPAELLPEWCRLAAATDSRAPDERLPALLARFARDPDHAHVSAVLPVLGARGRWLARWNPEWWAAMLSFEEPETAWQTGNLDQRVRGLRCLRARDPDQARGLLVSAWATHEDSSDRAKLLARLDEGLSIDDAHFLENVLDEKGVAVRRTAAGLLTRLPESDFCERMASRASALVSVRQDRALLKRRVTVDVTLPEPGDKAWTRDGIEFKARGKLGTKAHALSQIIAATPLSIWDQHSRTGPADLVSAAKKTEWAQAVIGGWAAAAVLQRNGQWAEALLNEYFAEADPQAVEIDFDVPAALMTILDPAGRERLLAPWATKKDAWGADFFRAMLVGCDHEWSKELSLALLTSLRKHLLRIKGSFDERLRRLVTGWVALHLNPSVAGDAANVGPTDDGSRWVDELIAQLTSILNFRWQLQEVFRT